MPSKANDIGWDHKKERAAMPAPTGQPCPFCRKPMWPDQDLDADHEAPRVLGGRSRLRWAHAKCNRSAGAVLGNLLRGRGGGQDTWENRWA